MQEALDNLEKVHNRRKALVWVSEGYDFNPFQDSRLGLARSAARRSCRTSPTSMVNNAGQRRRHDDVDGTDPMIQQQKQSETFSDAELAYELGEITRAANRANTTIYTIDPRGLVAGSDIDEQVDPHRVEQLRAEVAGQPARAGGRDRRRRRRQHERLRQGAEADRRGEQRLLRARLLLEQSRRDQAPPPDRGEGHAQGRSNVFSRKEYVLQAA